MSYYEITVHAISLDTAPRFAYLHFLSNSSGEHVFCNKSSLHDLLSLLFGNRELIGWKL
jgi:hypothetical protein